MGFGFGFRVVGLGFVFHIWGSRGQRASTDGSVSEIRERMSERVTGSLRLGFLPHKGGV